MNHLTANLIAGKFPELARVLCGLSKGEFASEPEIVVLALQNGLFKAVAAVGHTERMASMLQNKRISSKEIGEAMMLACDHKQYSIIRLLLTDHRLNFRKLKVGLMSADVVSVLFESPHVIPTSADIVYAVFGSHGGHRMGDIIYKNSLDTLRLILEHPSLELSDQFCEELCNSVADILENHAEKVNLLGKKISIFHKTYPCFTDFVELRDILIQHEQFCRNSTVLVNVEY